MARFLVLLLKHFAPVIAWAGVQVFVRVPAWPFLALTPARTTFGRATSVALLLAGLLGIVALLSLSAGTWLLIVAIVLAAGVTIGCGRAFATFWLPGALAAALLAMGLGLAWLPRVSPWALRIDGQSEQTPVLIVGGFGLVGLAFMSTAMTADALRRLEPPVRPSVHRRENAEQPPEQPKRRRSRRRRGRR